MPAFDPPAVTLRDTAPDDPRVGHLLGRALGEATEARVVLLGFPSDEGVRRNGGRPGAARAPNSIRQHLYAFTPDARHFDAFTHLLLHTADLGDLVLGPSLEANQERLGEALAPWLERGAVPIILGGGHETSYGHFLGYVRAGRGTGIVNLDAHADVRPLKDGLGHSGSPFRQALEHESGSCTGYTVAGVLPHSLAQAHAAYLSARGARWTWRGDLDREHLEALFTQAEAPLFATFDMDAVDQAYAPGVSAPAAGGLTADLWLDAAFEAGRSPLVTSIDLVEVNPEHDPEHRTARLAALTLWHLLRGLSHRIQP